MKRNLLFVILSLFVQASFGQVLTKTVHCDSLKKDVHVLLTFLASNKAQVQIQAPSPFNRSCSVSRYTQQAGSKSVLALMCGESSSGLPELMFFDAETLKARVEFEKLETELNCYR